MPSQKELEAVYTYIYIYIKFCAQSIWDCAHAFFSTQSHNHTRALFRPILRRVHTGHPMRIESSLSTSTLNAHSPNPDLIWINPNPLPEVVSIRIELDHAIARCAQGPKRAWHACLCRLPTVSTLLWATHCVLRICSTQEAIWWLAKVKIWWGHHSSCVEMWPLEVNMHAWIQFCTTQCGCDRCALGNSVTELVWIRIQCGCAFTRALSSSVPVAQARARNVSAKHI